MTLMRQGCRVLMVTSTLLLFTGAALAENELYPGDPGIPDMPVIPPIPETPAASAMPPTPSQPPAAMPPPSVTAPPAMPAQAAPPTAVSSASPGIAFEVKAGTLGGGVEISKTLSPNVALRVGYNSFDYKANETEQDIKYSADLHLKSETAILDFYPSAHSSFGISLGAAFTDNHATAVALPSNGTLTINGTQYQSSVIGSLTGNVSFPKTAFYIGTGTENPARSGAKVRVIFDIGALIESAPKVTLTAQNPTIINPTTGATLGSDLAAEEQKDQNDIKNLKFYPVIDLGLAIHF